MKIDEIKELIQALEQSQLTSLEVSQGNDRLRLEKNYAAAAPSASQRTGYGGSGTAASGSACYAGRSAGTSCASQCATAKRHRSEKPNRGCILRCAIS